MIEMEVQKLKLVTRADYLETHVQYRVKNQLWDMELFQNAGNLLGSIAGAVSSDDKHGSTKMQSALSGALMGGGAGWMIGGSEALKGSVGGPMGMGIGAAIGLIGGLMLD